MNERCSPNLGAQLKEKTKKSREHSLVSSLQVDVVRRQVEFLHVGHRGEVEEPRGANGGERQGAHDDGVGVRGDKVAPAVEDLFQ